MKTRPVTYVQKTTNDVYRDIAIRTGLTAEDVASIGGLESKHGKYDRPMQGGSARGLFQFQPQTAEHLLKGSSKTLKSLHTQANLMTLYIEQNKVKNALDAFIKHNLGPSRGTKFLEANGSSLVTSVVPARVIRSNRSLYSFKTVREAKSQIKKHLSEGVESSDIRPNFIDMFRETCDG